MRRGAAAVALAAVGAAAVAAAIAIRHDSGADRGDERAHPLVLDRRRHLTLDPGPPRGRPLLVLLHGRGAEPADLLWDELLTAWEGLGRRAPALLLVDGGDRSYFHDRADYRWGTHVLEAAIPAARKRLQTDPRREAIAGFSMGGFGALDLARLRPFCAVGGHSPALWETAGETPAGAFDDAEDFARHDLFALARTRPQLFRGARVWLDVGRDDPFSTATEAFGRLMGVRVRVRPGEHGETYWRRHASEYLDFYATALARCRSSDFPVGS